MLQFNTVEDAPKDPQKGRTTLVTDHEDRENEGGFIYAAQYATTENVNFMAVHGKGLICMPTSMEFCRKLEFPQTAADSGGNHETASTVSVNHVSTTTGISVAEWGATARFYMDDHARPGDLRRPGYVFPLMARKNGVLEREGHTEVTVGLMCLAGLKEYGLCCEIMKEDGIMMRTSELMDLARKWELSLITIQAIKDYRKQHECLMECMAVTSMPTRHGDFKVYGYVNRLNGGHHAALIKGEIGDGRGLLRRVHSECLTGDASDSTRYGCGQWFAAAVKRIEKEGWSTLPYIRQEGRGIGLINKLRVYQLQDQGTDTLDTNLALGFDGDMREYYIGAQTLRDLRVKALRLLINNPDKVYQLSGFGMEITERVPIQIEATDYDILYLKTKQRRMGHILNCR